MRLTRFTASNTLLTYSVTPSPLPLQVSPPSGAPTLGALTIVVSNNSEEVISAELLTFHITIGDPEHPQALDLTDVDGGFGVAVQGGEWTLAYTGEGLFTAKPKAVYNRRFTGQGLAFTISGIQVSRSVGTTTLVITEDSFSPSTPRATRRAETPIAKFPHGFFAGDLTARPDFVRNEQSAELAWAGADATYTMYWEDQQRDVTPLRTWATPGLTRTTNFVLEVKAQEHGSDVKEHFAVNVTVANPSLVAHSLKVETTTELKGTLHVDNRAEFMADVAVTGRITDKTGPVFPVGGIIMWSGPMNAVPHGWVLCDGRPGTPDLRGRFVVGYSGEGDYRTMGEKGGLAQVQLSVEQMPSHAHNGTTAGAGDHHHWMEGTNAQGLAWRRRRIWGDTTTAMGYGGGRNADPDHDAWRGMVNTDNAGAHVHTFGTTHTGASHAHENRPPYLVLAYIMKT
jgi:microcystin-dependent protein